MLFSDHIKLMFSNESDRLYKFPLYKTAKIHIAILTVKMLDPRDINLTFCEKLNVGNQIFPIQRRSTGYSGKIQSNTHILNR